MTYGMIVSGADLNNLATEVNTVVAKLEARIKDLEDKAAPVKAKKVVETKEKA